MTCRPFSQNCRRRGDSLVFPNSPATDCIMTQARRQPGVSEQPGHGLFHDAAMAATSQALRKSGHRLHRRKKKLANSTQKSMTRSKTESSTSSFCSDIFHLLDKTCLQDLPSIISIQDFCYLSEIKHASPPLQALKTADEKGGASEGAIRRNQSSKLIRNSKLKRT